MAGKYVQKFARYFSFDFFSDLAESIGTAKTFQNSNIGTFLFVFQTHLPHSHSHIATGQDDLMPSPPLLFSPCEQDLLLLLLRLLFCGVVCSVWAAAEEEEEEEREDR